MTTNYYDTFMSGSADQVADAIYALVDETDATLDRAVFDAFSALYGSLRGWASPGCSNAYSPAAVRRDLGADVAAWTESRAAREFGALAREAGLIAG